VPFKANADRHHHIPEQKFEVTNWHDYDASLRQRGSLTIWFTEEAIAAWAAACEEMAGSIVMLEEAMRAMLSGKEGAVEQARRALALG